MAIILNFGTLGRRFDPESPCIQALTTLSSKGLVIREFRRAKGIVQDVTCEQVQFAYVIVHWIVR